MDNGRLIDPDSGDIIWAPAEPAAEQSAPTPMRFHSFQQGSSQYANSITAGQS
ncbi:MAG: hypothetical protein R2912_07260 [Eubacteriales bacterium]